MGGSMLWKIKVLASIVFSSSSMKGSPFHTFLPFSPLKRCQKASKGTSITYCPKETPWRVIRPSTTSQYIWSPNRCVQSANEVGGARQVPERTNQRPAELILFGASWLPQWLNWRVLVFKQLEPFWVEMAALWGLLLHRIQSESRQTWAASLLLIKTRNKLYWQPQISEASRQHQPYLKEKHLTFSWITGPSRSSGLPGTQKASLSSLFTAQALARNIFPLFSLSRWKQMAVVFFSLFEWVFSPAACHRRPQLGKKSKLSPSTSHVYSPFIKLQWTSLLLVRVSHHFQVLDDPRTEGCLAVLSLRCGSAETR